MDPQDKKDALDLFYEIFLQPKRKPTWAEQMSKPNCTPLTDPDKCEQPDICFFHTKVFEL